MKTAIKKLPVALLVLAMLLSIAPPLTLNAQEISINISGQQVEFTGQGAFIQNDLTLIPARDVFEQMGYDFSQIDSEIILTDGGSFFVRLTVGSNYAVLERGEIVTNVELAAPVQVIGDTVMVPARSLLEGMGYNVDWDDATSTVIVFRLTQMPIALTREEEARVFASEFMRNLTVDGLMRATWMMTEGMQLNHDLALSVLLPWGDVVDFELISAQYIEGHYVLDIYALHTTGVIVHGISVNPRGQISGHFAMSDFELLPGMPGAYAEYTSEAVIIGEGTDWPLDGILTMPNTASAENPVPAVILVHGSGAHNMDSSIFNNRPFFDIADYLSSNGIAVLRYDKRTLTHGLQFVQEFGDDATVWEEAIEDAVLAAELLRADERVGDVFVVGLSLGGMLAPRIAEEAGLDGVIMLAASPRALYEVSYDQNHQHIGIALEMGAMSEDEAEYFLAMVAELLEEARNMHEMTRDELRGTMIFGLPGLYQLSIVESLPLPFISRNDTPVLILQGDRDFQVTADVDFQIFLDYTSDMAHVTAILYENVNHIFMLSQTPYNDLRDYMLTGNVYERVLRDIIEWVKGLAD